MFYNLASHKVLLADAVQLQEDSCICALECLHWKQYDVRCMFITCKWACWMMSGVLLCQVDGLRANVVTYNTLIDIYGKLGRWQDAIGVLDMIAHQVTHPHHPCFYGPPPYRRSFQGASLAVLRTLLVLSRLMQCSLMGLINGNARNLSFHESALAGLRMFVDSYTVHTLKQMSS